MKSITSIIYTFVLLYSSTLFSQEPVIQYVLNTPIGSNITKEYIARDFVEMVNGFNTNPDINNYVLAKTDPRLVFTPEGDLTGGSPVNNNGGVVGTLPGGVSVSPSGAAIYSLPVTLPPGINGMTPALGIVYNSQSGNGLLGLGWSLTGLSSISRTGTTLYNEGFIDGVDFDDNDQLMLDGQRLIPINEQKTEFRTEVETFSKIVIGESNSYGPLWFEVYTKDGRILEYGRSMDSRILASGRMEVLAWNLNLIRDRKDNSIEYVYSPSSDNEIRIAQIKYGKNLSTTQEAFYSIDFLYNSNRIDENTYYISGSKVEINSLLSEIVIKYIPEQTKVYNYSFIYNEDGNITHLERILIENSDGDTWNPTIFEWGEEGQDFQLESSNIQNADFSADHVIGDFNGDGKSDVVNAYYTYDQNDRVYDHWSVSFSNENGTTFNEIDMGSLDFTWEFLKFSYFVACDINGDGVSDLLMVREKVQGGEPVFVSSFYTSTSTNFELCAYTLNVDFSSHYFRVVDMNGNGIDELLLVRELSDNRTLFEAFELSGSGFESLFSNFPLNSGYYFEHQSDGLFKIQPGDFNGDGKTDLLVNTEELESTIFQLDVQNEVLIELNETRFGFPNKYHRVLTGDFNGDRVTDILTYAVDNPENFWQLHHFNGESEWIEGLCPITKTVDPQASDFDFNYIVSDYNGDGKSDILEVYNEYEGFIILGSWFNVYYSDGLDFIKNSIFFDELVPYNNQLYTNYDFNGDGKSDCFINTGTQSTPRSILFFKKWGKENSIEKITNGLGNVITINYSTLTNSNIYSKGTDSEYPLRDVQPAINVVENISIENGCGGSNTQDYLYEGALIHLQGKGFLGFSTITTLSDVGTSNEAKSVTIFKTNTEYFFNWVDQVKSYGKTISPEFILISETQNAPPEITDYGSKRFFYYFPKILSKIYHTGDLNSNFISTNLILQSIDANFGNLASYESYSDPEQLSINTPVQEFDFYSKSSYIYSNNTEEWLLGLASSKSTSSWSSQDPSIDNNYFQYYYYPHSQYLQSIVHTPNGSVPLTTKSEYEYDEYGNVIYSRDYAPYFTPAVSDKVTHFEFNSQFHHRFNTKTWSTLGETDFVTEKSYYNALGAVESTTDLAGNTTIFYYDGFGNLIQTNFPDGTQAKSVHFWSANSDDNPQFGLYYRWSQVSGEPEIVVFSDNNGRELRSITRDYKNDKIYRDIVYNGLGQVEKESNLHYTSGNILWTEYSYTNSGLVKTINSPTANIIYEYLGRVTNTTNTTINIQSQKEVNAIGQTIKVVDPSGSISYTYFGSGNLKELSSSGMITSMQYDEAGRQKLLVDPSAGITSYIYNPFGELISQTDANNNTYKTEYDGLGRISKKFLVGDDFDIVNYKYYPAESIGFGKVQELTMANGVKESFKYDNLGRTVSKTKVIDDVEYEFNYEYNIFGKTKKQIWPSGFTVDYQYKNGYFTSVVQSSTGKLLWNLTDVNAQGQIKQYELGNGLLTTKGYNIYGFPESITTSNNVQDNNYLINVNTGNLSWRSSSFFSENVSYNLKENFSYDNVLNNRLETWSVEGSGVLNSITYENNGNITSKSDIGTYDYSLSGSPYAVTRIKQPDAIYLGRVKTSEQHIDYTGFNKVDKLWTAGSNDQSLILSVTYGPSRSRCKTELLVDGGLSKTKLFIDPSFEIIIDAQGNKNELHYIAGGDGVFAIYVEDNSDEGVFNYLHKDYLGSYEVITDENATVIDRISYDPWGRRRNPLTWLHDNTPINSIFDRGYTGHEHIEEFGLINMNGRIYDPCIARFLSPDNFIQSPNSIQNLNRYSYVLNNPLIYTDPDGEIFIPILIGVAVGVLTNGINNSVNDRPFFEGAGTAALIGGISGAFAYGIGQAAMGMSGFGKVAFQTLAHGHLSGIMSGMNGGTYGQGFLSGAAGSLIGGGANSLLQNSRPIFQALGTVSAGALSGGIGAELMGGNFWDGARNGTISAGLNHFGHQAFYDTQLKKMYNIYKKSVEVYGTAEAFYKFIGGDLGDWAAESPEQFQNTCAARLSYALNYGGFEIPERTPGTYLGGDGKSYFIKADVMAAYLSNTKVWGMPAQARSYSHVRNAVIFQTGFRGGVTGHLDIIYRGIAANHIYPNTTFFWH